MRRTLRRTLRRQSSAAVTQQAYSPRSHTNPLSQYKRSHYSRRIRRTLRRNQATTRPPAPRTGSALQDPTSYALHDSTSNHHSASGEHHCNLACHPHYIEEQEEELQQANAENTTEKPSGNKAPSTKNTAQLFKIPRHILSTVPHQIIT